MSLLHLNYPAGATPLNADEIAVRFHHRLVWIHPFANGNGRWARMAADLLLVSLGAARFTWGAGGSETGLLDQSGDIRQHYIHALQKADARDYHELLAFARA